MKAVILAAGEGRRLRPYTETMPKVMLPVANKPILEYVIDAVTRSGIDEIIIVVGYKKEVIMESFKDYTTVPITYVTQEQQLGTSHALLQAKNYLKEQTFLVLSGDNIIDHQSIAMLTKEKADYSLLIKEHPHPSKYGVVSIEKKELKEIVEKPKEDMGNFVSTGIYKLPFSIFDDIETFASQGIYGLSFVIQSLLNRNEIITTHQAKTWKDIVYPWDLIHVNETMLQHLSGSISGTVEKGVTLKGPVSIGKDTKVYAGCYIIGPVVIGEGCEIGPHACIFPSTAIGDNAVIHPFSEIRDSVLMDGVHLGSNSLLSHSIIGRDTSIHNSFSSIAGKTTVKIEDEYQKLSRMGAMIGEDCTIGSNVVVGPGIKIGRKCTVQSLTKIEKNIPSETTVM